MTTDTPLPGLPTAMTGTALGTEDGNYLWVVTRRWGDGDPAFFVMLHPTAADDTTDDATVHRCVALAHGWGYTRAVMVNLYARRAPRRDDLWKAADPVGGDNDRFLQREFAIAAILDAPLVAAWGSHARRARVEAVLGLPGAERFVALGCNADGSPVHPTHAAPDAAPVPWRP